MMDLMTSVVNRYKAKEKLTRKEESEFTYSVYQFELHAKEVLRNDEAFGRFIRFVEEVENYSGKNSQKVHNSWQNLFRSIDCYIEIGDDEALPEEISSSLQKLAKFYLMRVVGKPARTKKLADRREVLWDTLAQISLYEMKAEILKEALSVFGNEKCRVEERYGALLCVLTHWEKGDEKTTKLINQVRKNPPNEDFLMSILDAEVDLGLLDPMAAMVELEDYREANDEW